MTRTGPSGWQRVLAERNRPNEQDSVALKLCEAWLETEEGRSASVNDLNAFLSGVKAGIQHEATRKGRP